MAQYGKAYDSEGEAVLRFRNFVASLRASESLQAQANREDQNATVLYGVTKFSDLTHAEFVKFAAPGKGAHGKPGPNGTPDYPNTYIRSPPKGFLPPPFVDWRSKAGVVSAVKDQGQCGGCWVSVSKEPPLPARNRCLLPRQGNGAKPTLVCLFSFAAPRTLPRRVVPRWVWRSARNQKGPQRTPAVKLERLLGLGLELTVAPAPSLA